MCDILSKNLDISKYNEDFEHDKLVYIENFIKNDVRLNLVNYINGKKDDYKIKNGNSILSILGQLDAKNNTSDDNILKQHYVISGNDMQKYFSDLHYYYHNCFADTVSKIVGRKVYPINEKYTMNNSLIIYENEGDSLRWHTDKSMFNDKKVYTLLVYLYNNSSQNLCYINHDKKKDCIFTKENSCVILEHFTLEHAVTQLKKNEKKILWSMTYAEDINITSLWGYIQNKGKNLSYLGLSALNSIDILFILILIICFLMIIWKYLFMKKSKIKKFDYLKLFKII